MPLKKDTRPFKSLDDEEFDDLVDAELDDHETLLKVLREASARGYSADGVAPVLDRFLERALDSLFAEYKELFDLFFDGTALEYFVDDARKYLDVLELGDTEEAAVDDEEDDEDKEDDDDSEELNESRRRSSPMPTMRFPVSDYYAEHILEGITLSNKGGWWSAVLLIRDPKTKKPFLALYRWEQKDGVWKNRKSFVIRDQAGVAKVISALNELKSKLHPT
jgi:hypothetical protein